jgi:hypothetical protein
LPPTAAFVKPFDRLIDGKCAHRASGFAQAGRHSGRRSGRRFSVSGDRRVPSANGRLKGFKGRGIDALHFGDLRAVRHSRLPFAARTNCPVSAASLPHFDVRRHVVISDNHPTAETPKRACETSSLMSRRVSSKKAFCFRAFLVCARDRQCVLSDFMVATVRRMWRCDT